MSASFERLLPDELALVLAEGFWTPGQRADRVHERLMDSLARLELGVGHHAPFDEVGEDDIHPVLIDAGWELHPLAALDPERHKGAIQAFREPILFEAARFEERERHPPSPHASGAPRLRRRGAASAASDGDGSLVEPLVVWTEGDATYHDYVLRGVLRAAKVGEG